MTVFAVLINNKNDLYVVYFKIDEIRVGDFMREFEAYFCVILMKKYIHTSEGINYKLDFDDIMDSFLYIICIREDFKAEDRHKFSAKYFYHI